MYIHVGDSSGGGSCYAAGHDQTGFLSKVIETMRNSQPLGGPAFDQGACYHILLRGRLDQSWSEDLAGMTVTAVQETRPDPGLEPSQEPVTLLAGWLPDQAALYGLLQFTYNLGLTILAVRRIDGPILDQGAPSDVRIDSA